RALDADPRLRRVVGLGAGRSVVAGGLVGVDAGRRVGRVLHARDIVGAAGAGRGAVVGAAIARAGVDDVAVVAGGADVVLDHVAVAVRLGRVVRGRGAAGGARAAAGAAAGRARPAVVRVLAAPVGRAVGGVVGLELVELALHEAVQVGLALVGRLGRVGRAG